MALRNRRNAIIAKQFHGTLPETGHQDGDRQAAERSKFQQEWMAFLDQLGTLLIAAGPVTLSEPPEPRTLRIVLSARTVEEHVEVMA